MAIIQLKKGLAELHLTLDENAENRLLQFVDFLQKWNKAYNLTAIHSVEKIITHHLLDSFSLVPFVENAHTILDLGTGAGFPGIPLAFYFPEKMFTLLDSNGKKIRFLLQAQATFGINNIIVEQQRIEKFLSPEKFDVIICRAVGKMSTILKASRSALKTRGQWIFMKGVYPVDELRYITFPYKVHNVIVPGVNALRHVVVIENDLD